ncbi:MAG: PIN domain-containing protein [Clostridiales bacterium]|nr:PIN domain-containing protein [Clostridiales bacterium]MCF8023577.1 PIN domain-containing protein [Clostridiales bacterium]
MEKVLVDAGAVFELLCANSRNYRAAKVILKQMRKTGMTPVLTNFIAAEAHGMLVKSLGPDAGRTWLRYNIWPVEHINESDERKVREIVLRPGADYTYIDATSFAFMERQGLKKVFSFNQAFARYGFTVLDI